MSDISQLFFDKVDEILSKELVNLENKKIAVALSGGSDSLALTLLLKKYCQDKEIELCAVTIDHKMRDSSYAEAQALSKVIENQKIPHHILEIPLEKIPQKNIEANLREIRYELLNEFCDNNEIRFLFFGHILGDVAENFLIRLFRGSGLDGLSPIAEISNYKEVRLIRPLLDFSKDDLQKFLQAEQVEWFEDETNIDEIFLRNKIRNFFNSFEEKDLIHKRIKNTSENIAQIRDFLDLILLKEAKKILSLERGYFVINLLKLQKLEEKIALKILALILMEASDRAYKPRLEKLKNFHKYLQQDKIKPYKFYGCIIKQLDETNIMISSEDPGKSALKLKTILKEIL